MKHDVIILGGGPNGLAAALALGSSTLPMPLRVLVLDQRDPNLARDDSRGTALTLSTQAMLKVLGVWKFLSPHATEMREVIVTDNQEAGHGLRPLLTLATKAGEPAAASMVENSKLLGGLLQAVSNSPEITLQGGFEFDHFEASAARIKVSDAAGHTHESSLLVAADGRKSRVRQQLGTKSLAHDYGQTALGFSIAIEKAHHGRAEEHFTPSGVFAVLPLQGLAASLVWGTTPDHAARLMAMDEDAFNLELQKQMGDHLGAVRLTGRRQSFPVVMQIANDLIGPRVALLGDAAHAIHPLAGLGLNLGFKDAAALADGVVGALRRGGDLGGATVLDHYQSLRRFDVLSTSWAMDGLNGLFVNDDPLLRPLRHLGLRLVDQMGSLKAGIMHHAGGQSQHSPRLMQGLLPG